MPPSSLDLWSVWSSPSLVIVDVVANVVVDANANVDVVGLPLECVLPVRYAPH